jgi:hypothetical protein
MRRHCCADDHGAARYCILLADPDDGALVEASVCTLVGARVVAAASGLAAAEAEGAAAGAAVMAACAGHPGLLLLLVSVVMAACKASKVGVRWMAAAVNLSPGKLLRLRARTLPVLGTGCRGVRRGIQNGEFGIITA